MGLGIEDVRKHLESAVSRQGFNQWLAPKIVKAEADELVLELSIRPEMTQHHGFVHGGCVAAFADTAAAWSGALAACQDVVTSNYSIQFLAPAKGPTLKAVAHPVKVGRSSATISVSVYSVSEGGDEKLCATTLAGIAIIGDRKTG